MTTKKITLLDNTRISAFKTCARYYYFSHIRHWRAEEKSPALTFGSSWGHAMDAIWGAQLLPAKPPKRDLVALGYDAFVAEWIKALPHPDELSPDDLENLAPRTPQIAKEMLWGYVEAREYLFSYPAFRVLTIEEPFAVPLDPDDPTLFYVGRVDKVFEHRGAVIGLDHKTTTSYKKGGPFRGDFVDSFDVSSQLDGYIYALRTQYGARAHEVWIDAALVHKQVHDGFKIIPEARAEEFADSWLWETMNWVDAIKGNIAALVERRDPDAPYMAAFPRNTNSCVQYGRCQFLDICRMCVNPETFAEPPLGYRYEPWSPLDELKLKKLGFTLENTAEPIAAAAKTEDVAQ
jgi:hypothetical protein